MMYKRILYENYNIDWATFYHFSGIFEPPLGKYGRLLPSARKISNQIFDREDHPNNNINVMFVVFGQYLDHDLDHVPVHGGKSICECGYRKCSNLKTYNTYSLLFQN